MSVNLRSSLSLYLKNTSPVALCISRLSRQWRFFEKQTAPSPWTAPTETSESLALRQHCYAIQSVIPNTFRASFHMVVVNRRIGVLGHGVVTTLAAYRLLGIRSFIDENLKHSPCVGVFVS